MMGQTGCRAESPVPPTRCARHASGQAAPPPPSRIFSLALSLSCALLAMYKCSVAGAGSAA